MRRDSPQEDIQPPMCGGAVFNKLRLKAKGYRKSDAANDQSPLVLPTPSMTSSDDSAEEYFLDPNTLLLPHVKRANEEEGKTAPTRETSLSPILEGEEMVVIQNVTKEKSPEVPGALRSDAHLQFDPIDNTKLRSMQIHSAMGKKRDVAPTEPDSNDTGKSSSKPNNSTPFTGAESAPGQDGKSRTETNPSPAKPQKKESGDKLRALRSMKGVVSQQQQTMQKMSSQNQTYRKKLEGAQRSFQKLYLTQMDQAGKIEKLRLERDSFQAENLLLREEVNELRRQLELFQNNQRKHPSPMSTEEPKIEESIVPAVTSDASGKEGGRAKEEEPVAVENDKTSNAKSYWKREWALSLQDQETATEATYSDVSNNGSKTNSEMTPVRGVDPPEVEPPQTELSGYEKDMEFVRQLLQKYETQLPGNGLSETSSKVDSQEQSVGAAAEEAQENSQEALVQIENMVEVERNQHIKETQIAAIQANLDDPPQENERRGQLDPATFETSFQATSSYQAETRAHHERSLSAKKNDNGPESCNDDTAHRGNLRFRKGIEQEQSDNSKREKSIGWAEQTSEAGSMDEISKFFRDAQQNESQHSRFGNSQISDISVFNERRDESFRSEHSGIDSRADQSFRSERSSFEPQEEGGYRIEWLESAKTENSYRSDRSSFESTHDGSDQSWFDSRQDDSTRSWRTFSSRGMSGSLRSERSIGLERSSHSERSDDTGGETREGPSPVRRERVFKAKRSARPFPDENIPLSPIAESRKGGEEAHDAVLSWHQRRLV